MQRVIIPGASYAGIRAGARIKRLKPRTDVVLILGPEPQGTRRSPWQEEERLADPALLKAKGLNCMPGEVAGLDFQAREVGFRGEQGALSLHYDALILDVDSRPRLPLFARAAKNALGLDQAINSDSQGHVVLLGGGPAILPQVEKLATRADRITWLPYGPGQGLDREVWQYLARHLEPAGIRLLLNDPGQAKPPEGRDNAPAMLRALASGDELLEADHFVWAEPRVARGPYLEASGLALDAGGLLPVNPYFQTMDPAVYALGSGVAVAHAHPAAAGLPLAADAVTAAARIVADHICGRDTPWPGACGTVLAPVPEVPDLAVCRTGLGSEEAVAAGLEAEFSIFCEPLPHSLQAPGKPSGELLVRLVADKTDGRVLGTQAVGPSHAAMALAAAAAQAVQTGASLQGLAALDLPGPGGLALQKAAHVIGNKLDGRYYGITPDELLESERQGAEFFLMDLRSQEEWRSGHLRGAANIPFEQLRARLRELPQHTPLVIYGNSSNRACNAACLLWGVGADQVYVLDGGFALWPYETELE